MANLTLVQAINLALVQEMEKDERVMILGEDVGLNGGVFRVTEGLFNRFGGDACTTDTVGSSGRDPLRRLGLLNMYYCWPQ